MNLNDIKALYNDGDKEAGREALIAYLKATPDDARAWAYLGAKTTDLEQRKYCYLKSLELADDETIQARLDKLDEHDPVAPPELTAKKSVKGLKKGGATPAPTPPKKSNFLLILGGLGGGVIFLCLCCFGFALVAPKPPPTPNPVAVATQAAPPTGENTPLPNQPPPPTDAPIPTDTPIATDTPVVAAKVGQKVVVGDTVWLISEAKNEGQTLKGDGTIIKDKVTSGQFYRLTFEIENKSSDPKNFLSLSLKDGQGREFQPYAEAIMYIDPATQCSFKAVNPGLSIRCQVVYELPQDVAGLQAVATNLNFIGREEVLISLQ